MRTSSVAFLVFLGSVKGAYADLAEGVAPAITKEIRIPVKVAALELQFPAQISVWMKSGGQGTFEVDLAVVADVARLYDETKALSAAALNRAPKCEYGIDVHDASLTRVDKLTLTYSVSLKYTQPVCAGGLVILRPSAEMKCEATGVVSYDGAIVSVAPRPAKAELCERQRQRNDLEASALRALGVELLERYDFDISKNLPEPFMGLAIDIRSVAFTEDKKLVAELASSMTADQFNELVGKLVAPSQ